MDEHRRKGSEATSGTKRNRYSNAGPRHHWEAEVGAIRVIFGESRLSELGGLATDLGAAKVLVVTDSGVLGAGHLDTAIDSLAADSIETRVFDQVTENPTNELVERAALEVSDFEPNCIVGIGGGSALDCAKAINFLISNGGKMEDYWGFGKADAPLLPSIGVPTTAGTGSEAQSFALISDIESGRKMACGDPQARYKSVILDASLTDSAPATVAAAAGFDAISHAVESYVTTRKNPISQLLSRNAWQLLDANLIPALALDANAKVRGQVLLAAHLGGAAIEQSMLGAAHACANPLTAAYGIMHGRAIGVLLPHVVRFNAEVGAQDYAALAELAGLEAQTDPGEALSERLEEIRIECGLPKKLKDLEIPKSDLPDLAEAAAIEWTARFNPRPVSQAELLSIYESAY